MKTVETARLFGIPVARVTEPEAVEKIIDLAKTGKVREISDVRDETGLNGLKITIDLKRSADPDLLMQKLSPGEDIAVLLEAQ